jgi:hypothetical protein
MATTTPNFGWPVPTSTDLVKDGATAIEALGDSIDASLLDLKGGITGQVLSKNSNTDMDFIWVTDAAGDITGVTAGTGISGGGTSGTVTVTNSMATAIDAKGDLVAGTAADTFSRLAVGANGTVLTADSAEATGLKWAATASSGGYTEIATGTLSSTALNITGISADYRDLVLVCKNFQNSGTFDVIFQLNSDSGSNYSWMTTGNPSSASSFSANCNSTAILTSPVGFRTNTATQIVFQLFNYADTSAKKLGQFTGGGFDNAANLKMTVEGSVFYDSTSAISGIKTTTAFASGTYKLYGVK